MVISKSGNTPETLVQTIAAIEAVRAGGLGDRIPELFLGLTEPRTGTTRNGLRDLLRSACRSPRFRTIRSIGGRFSALTNVGLLPALARGLDVEALREGAHTVVEGAARGARGRRTLLRPSAPPSPSASPRSAASR